VAGFGLLAMDEVEVLHEPLFEQYLAGLEFERPPRAGFPALENCLGLANI
jgi:hypothetical protein